MVVPQAEGAPSSAPGHTTIGKQLVAPPASTRLAFQQNAQMAATVKGNIPIRNLAPTATKRKSPIVKLVTWAVVLAGLGVGAYFGWGFYEQWREKANAKPIEEAKNSGGGDKANRSASRTGPGQPEGAEPAATPAPADGAPAPGQGNLPVVPPVYTLDVTQAKVPGGTVNGSISGSNFVAEIARIDAVGPAQVLRLTQGTPPVPERELLVYLRLKPGDKLSGHTWTISSDMKGADVPQVIKRWKVKAGYAPALKSYASGYAMKLELGALADGALSGRVFIALPDNEQTVAGGVFKATTSLTDVIGAVAPVPGAVAPGAAPGIAPPAPAGQSAFDKRYGGARRP